jgi:hypothetical protein
MTKQQMQVWKHSLEPANSVPSVSLETRHLLEKETFVFLRQNRTLNQGTLSWSISYNYRLSFLFLPSCIFLWIRLKLTSSIAGSTVATQEPIVRRLHENIILICVRFEVFKALTMKNAIFWDVTPCDSCKNWRRFLQEPHGRNIPEDTIFHFTDIFLTPLFCQYIQSQ